jgi:hypothetical protein
MKRFLLFSTLGICVGGFIGAVIAMIVAPSVLTWFQSLPGAGAMCSCSETTANTARSVVKIEMIFAAGGAVVGLLGGLLAWRRFPAHTPAAPAESVTPTTSPA